jgi:sugar lactone lactonase YvrE
VRRFSLVLLVLIASSALAGPAVAVPGHAGGAAGAFPDRIALPDGFFPEGIAVGYGTDVYAGSLAGGAIFRADLRTGDGGVLAPAVDGRIVAGLSFDRRSGLLWGVGSDAGAGAIFAFDGDTGASIHVVDVPGAGFLNDVVVAREALYVTDSLADVLWTVPLTNRGAPAGPAVAVPLSGDFVFVTEGALPLNLNGIEVTPDGKALFAVHTTLGVLYRIDPVTGVATQLDLGGVPVPSGDGLVLHGQTLYVVQNFLNQVAVIRLDPDGTSGRIVDTITSERFRVPTTAAVFGRSLYLVNARFDAEFPPFLGGDPDAGLDYDIVRVRR